MSICQETGIGLKTLIEYLKAATEQRLGAETRQAPLFLGCEGVRACEGVGVHFCCMLSLALGFCAAGRLEQRV